MLDTLISSKTRIKLLLKFFLNEDNVAYLRSLESDFGESSNAIRVELNKLEAAKMLISYIDGNKKYFKVNTSHPLYNDIKRIIHKHLGLDTIIEKLVENLGEVEEVYLTGQLARGMESSVIDLVFIGEINVRYLIKLIAKTEDLLSRKIRYLIFNNTSEFEEWKKNNETILLLWNKNKRP